MTDLPETVDLPAESARLAVLMAIHDKLGDAVKAQRERVQLGLNEAAEASGLRGAIDVKMPDGTMVAKANLRAPKARFVIVSPTAFAGWVQEHWPNEVELTVRPAFQAAIKKRFRAVGDTGDVVDADTGLEVAGVVAYAAPERSNSFELRFWPDAETGRGEVLRQWRAWETEGTAALPELEQ